VHKLFFALATGAIVVACSAQQTSGPCTLTPKGHECFADSECCTGYCLLQGTGSYCQDKPANTPACVAPQGFCTQNRNCCAGLCQANVCFGNLPPSGSCLQIGSECIDASGCCSNNCQMGSLGLTVCVSPTRPIDAGSCNAGGTQCTLPEECCTGVCVANVCAGSNPNPTNCGKSGATCRYGTDCCSKQCEQSESISSCK
jgi:hypothetical protein